jgi:uroporphyrinogen decarboxylase
VSEPQHTLTRREQVIRAIENRDPDYVPVWLGFFADETLDGYGEALDTLIAAHEDDVVVSVLSTFPAMSGMPKGWTDEWGCTWNHSPDGVGAVSVDSPLHGGWERLEWYLDHGLPRQEQRTDLLDRVLARRAAYPDRYLMATTYLAVFERLRCLRGAENVLTDLYSHPQELATLRDAIAEEFAGQIRGVAVRGADAVLLADDYGTQRTMLISPRHWRSFFQDCYARLVEVIHEQGMHAWFHSCGHIRPIIPDLVDVGFDLLHPLQPSSMDLHEIAQAFGGRICFAGAIDVQGLLPVADSGTVEAEIRRMIDLLDGPHGGYVVAPTNSIMPDTPLENIEAMYRTASSYGREKRRPGVHGDVGLEDTTEARVALPRDVEPGA